MGHAPKSNSRYLGQLFGGGNPKIRGALRGGCRVSIRVIGGLGFRLSQDHGYLFGGPQNKDYDLLETKLGFPYLGNLPFRLRCSSTGRNT